MTDLSSDHRQQLLDAAFACGMTEDLAALDLAGLARRTGVPVEGTLLCFPDHATLIVALHREFLDRLLSQVAAQMAAAQPGAERLQSGISAFLDYCLQHAPLRAQLLALEDSMPQLGALAASRRSGFRVMLTMEISHFSMADRVDFARRLRARIEEVSLVEVTHGGPRSSLRDQIWTLIESEVNRQRT